MKDNIFTADRQEPKLLLIGQLITCLDSPVHVGNLLKKKQGGYCWGNQGNVRKNEKGLNCQGKSQRI